MKLPSGEIWLVPIPTTCKLDLSATKAMPLPVATYCAKSGVSYADTKRGAAGTETPGMKTVKFGIIGAGLMGREFASAAARWAHLLDLDVRPEIAAVCDRNPAVLPCPRGRPISGSTSQRERTFWFGLYFFMVT